MTPEIPSRHALLQQIDFQNPKVKYPRVVSKELTIQTTRV